MQAIELQLPEQLQADINFLKSELSELRKNLQPKKPTEFVTRQYVADEMLHSGLTTVHNLTVKGILKKYTIGGRVLYKRSEVEQAIVEL